MASKKDSIRKKKESRKKARRENTTSEGERARRKRQSEEERGMGDDQEDLTSSEEYEEKALEAIDAGASSTASIYAQLALVATIREAVFVFAEIIDPDGAQDYDDDE